ncbi:MAG: hypothetical protein HeimC3_24950 [Candidatus Heimdallarchaeota archaeon LC_3]|nr:MAG: hypothetical protein HeimC3_24950 [Candidatus Heimdallarchaeota archaeon LC_3]
MKKWLKTILIGSITFLVLISIISIINSDNPEYIIIGLRILLSNYELVVFFLILFALAFFFRALRWNLLLLENTKEKLYFYKLIYIAWFLNAVTPSRIGDLSRVYYPRKDNKSSAGNSLFALIVDRLLDLSMLVFLLFFWLLYGFSFVDNEYQLWILIVVLGMISSFFFLIVLISFYPEVIEKWVKKLPNKTLQINLLKVIQNFNQGILSLKRTPIRFVASIGLTISIWILESTSVFLIARALGFQIDFTICMMAATLGFIGAAIPLLPGGLGSYEAGIGTVLLLLTPLTIQEAILIAFFDHMIRELFVIFVGGILFVFKKNDKNRLFSEEKQPEISM